VSIPPHPPPQPRRTRRLTWIIVAGVLLFALVVMYVVAELLAR
jgi:hypothetical protein